MTVASHKSKLAFVKQYSRGDPSCPMRLRYYMPPVSLEGRKFSVTKTEQIFTGPARLMRPVEKKMQFSQTAGLGDQHLRNLERWPTLADSCSVSGQSSNWETSLTHHRPSTVCRINNLSCRRYGA